MRGTAALSCTGAPTGAACSLPTNESVSGSVASTFTVTLSTTARTSSWLLRPGSALGWMWVTALVGLALLPGSRPSLRRFIWLPLLLVGFLSSCGGGSGGTPAGTYALSVTATLNGTMQSQGLPLIVQ